MRGTAPGKRKPKHKPTQCIVQVSLLQIQYLGSSRDPSEVLQRYNAELCWTRLYLLMHLTLGLHTTLQKHEHLWTVPTNWLGKNNSYYPLQTSLLALLPPLHFIFLKNSPKVKWQSNEDRKTIELSLLANLAWTTIWSHRSKRTNLSNWMGKMLLPKRQSNTCFQHQKTPVVQGLILAVLSCIEDDVSLTLRKF